MDTKLGIILVLGSLLFMSLISSSANFGFAGLKTVLDDAKLNVTQTTTNNTNGSVLKQGGLLEDSQVTTGDVQRDDCRKKYDGCTPPDIQGPVDAPDCNNPARVDPSCDLDKEDPKKPSDPKDPQEPPSPQ